MMNFDKIVSEGLDSMMDGIKNLSTTTNQQPAQTQTSQPVQPTAYEVMFNGKSILKARDKNELLKLISTLP